jgi:iron complex outermembrane receptor protein
MKKQIRTLSLTTTILFAGAVGVAPGSAQGVGPDPEGGADIVVTGSRFGSRSIAESPTPIDHIGTEELNRGGRVEIQEMLKTAVPSFSTPRPNASGVGDFTTPPTLRGLSTGQLLVLVNGKRRHSSGDLSTSNGIGRGDVAYDFNSIPSAAIGHIEVLRDGASAQYGSDAIAGVINLSLDKSEGVSGKVTTGITKQGDGEYVDVGAGFGLAIGDGGIIRTTVQYQNRRGSNRADPDTRQQYFGTNAAGAPTAISSFYGSGVGLTPSNGTLDPREATVDRDTSYEGTAPFTMKAIFVNSELPVGDAVTLYGFGGYSDLDGKTANFFRRAGQDQTVRSLHPDGYAPYGEFGLRNLSAFGGARGDDLAGFGWDLSTGFGKSLINSDISNSNNPSLGNASPTEMRISRIRFSQWTTNLDLTREFDVGDSTPLKFAFGGEYRKEVWRLLAGDPASYVNGGVGIIGGPANGAVAPVGAQPNPGVSPADATTGKRNSNAVYGELEKEFFDRLTLNGAVRYEDFSDFGDTVNYKLSSRLKLVEALALRGSFSTGFRAPHLAQSFFNSSLTNFINGAPVLIRNFPVDSAAGRLIGATPLKPEKSRNISIGAVAKLSSWTITLDGYRIKLKDRIVQSSTFQDARLTNLLAANGFPGIGGAQYLTNAVDSTTHGVDLTVSGSIDLDDFGKLAVLLAGNYNKTKLDRVAGTPAPLAALGITTPLFDLTQQVRITDSQPRSKVLLNLNWSSGDFTVGLTNTYYGKVSAVAFTTLTPAQIAVLTQNYDVTLVPVSATSPNSQVIQHFKGKLITDLQLSYDMTKEVRLTVGVNNLFDIYPSQNIRSTVASVAAGTNGSDNGGTFPYNAISPFGFNGMSFFASASVRF